jgi:hypothetical protein
LVTPILGAASATSVTVAAGAVGTPSITTTGDTNTGIFFPAADTIAFAEGGAEAMRIDSSGNVGIGTSSPGQKLEVNNGASDVTVLSKTTGASYASFRVTNSSRDYSMQIRTDVSNAWVLRDETAGANRLVVDTSGNLQFNSGYGSAATAYGCRAWVNFNGTGTVAILASGNVSSITDNGTGEYTVNFTSAMPDANYVVSGSASFNNDNTLPQAYLALSRRSSSLQTASAAPVSCVIGNSVYDCQRVEVAIFR